MGAAEQKGADGGPAIRLSSKLAGCGGQACRKMQQQAGGVKVDGGPAGKCSSVKVDGAQAAARFTLTTARSLCYFIRAPYEYVGHFGQ